MIKLGTVNCPDCGRKMSPYGSCKRYIKSCFGKKKKLHIWRFHCIYCNRFHRAIPNYIVPYKHYAKNIITGFISGSLTSSMIEFEDYPVELTVKNWKLHKKDLL